MQRFVLVCLVCGGAGIALANPATTSVRTLLGGIEFAPTAEQWQRLGPNAGAQLRTIARDRDELPSTRLRAVAALAYFPTSQSRVVLNAILQDPHAGSLMRRRAAIALAVGFGTGALELIAPYAGDSDNRLRDDVARALGIMKDDRARAVLRARLPFEQTFVRKTIERALGEGL